MGDPLTMPPRDGARIVVAPRPAATARPQALPPLLVLGAAGSGVQLAGEIAVALGWADHSPALHHLHGTLFTARDWSLARPPTAELVRACGEHAVPELTPLAAQLQEAPGSRPFVLADSRLAITLSWWQPMLPAHARVVLARRNPLAVARSMQRRSGVAIRRGLAWWEHQWTLALAELHGRPVHLFSFESVVAGAQQALPFAAGLLGTPVDDAAPLLPALQAVLRPPAPRDAVSERELDTYLTVRQRDLWTFLSILPPVVERLDVPSTLRAPSPGALAALMEGDQAIAGGTPPAAGAEPGVDDAPAGEPPIADVQPRVPDPDAVGLRHRLQVALYEQSNLRATLTRIERARQTTREELSHWRARAADAEARLAAAQEIAQRWQQERQALEASRTWRLAHGLARLWRRLRPQRRRDDR